MIEASIAKAKEVGYSAILTLGFAHHYTPYGFKGGKAYNVAMGDGQYYKGLLVLPCQAVYEAACMERDES